NQWLQRGLRIRLGRMGHVNSLIQTRVPSDQPVLWRLLSFRPIGKGFVNSKTKKKKAGKPQSKGGAVSVYADIESHMSHDVVNSLAYPFVDREYPATLSIRGVVEGLNSVQPESLSAYPSILYQLALEARAGRLHIAPKRIASGAEP